MCELCKGTGGVSLQQSWGVEFLPCNHPECDYDREKGMKELEETINELKRKLKVSEAHEYSKRESCS